MGSRGGRRQSEERGRRGPSLGPLPRSSPWSPPAATGHGPEREQQCRQRGVNTCTIDWMNTTSIQSIMRMVSHVTNYTASATYHAGNEQILTVQLTKNDSYLHVC